MANPQSDLIGGEEDFAAMLEESFKGKGTTKGGELKENEIVRGSVVQLTPLEFRLLYMLAMNEGRVIPYDRLVEYAWGYEGGESSLLKTHVCHIRSKLGMKEGAGPYIKGVPWVGYQLTRE